MSGISLSYPFWYLAVSALGGVVYALALYFGTKDFENKSPWLKPGLGFLRFFSIAGILFLLLDPIITTYSKRLKKPVILIAQDNSESVGSGMKSPADSLAFTNAFDQMRTTLQQNYEVQSILFGDTPREGKKPDFSDQETDISSALRYLYDQYRAENVGAVILATDGNFNRGLHPLYSSPQLAAPIYTIALGDTTVRRDATITAVYHNNIAYLGDLLKVHIDVKAHLLKGKQTFLRVLGLKNGKYTTLSKEKLYIDQEDFFKSLEMTIPAETPGYTRFIAKIDPVAGEINTRNNAYNFYIDVLQSRQKILIIAHGAHPDIGTIKKALEQNENNEVTIQYADHLQYTKGKADLVILHQLPSYRYAVSGLLAQLKKDRTPTLFVAGLQTNFIALNEAQDAVFIRPSGGAQLSEVTAAVNRQFDGFHVSGDLAKHLEQFPSISTAFGSFTPKPNAKTFLFQRILKVDTKHALLSFGRKDGRKTGVFCGVGLYKWRLFDYLKYQSHQNIETLIQNTARYLIVKEDKSRFRVKPIQPFFKESEAVRFYAERYNSVYQKDNTEEVSLTLRDSSGNKFEYSFSRSEDAYTLDIGKLPAGAYKYTASTKLEGKQVKKSGSFTVSLVDVEQNNTSTNQPLLSALSEKTGGKMLFPSQLDSLTQWLTTRPSIKPIAYSTSRTRPLIHLKWPLFILLLTLALEWFLRRYHGKY